MTCKTVTKKRMDAPFISVFTVPAAIVPIFYSVSNDR